jgi:hypothetical protein
MMKIRFIFLVTGVIFISSCSSNDHVYTLYRNSVIDSNMRIHIATFDAKEDEVYNKENCELARDLFQKQEGVTAKFWCEKGRYKK